MAPSEDEAIRCERCGYPRRGLPPSRPCPECGFQSRSPRRRRGVPREVKDLPGSLVRRVRRAAWIAAAAAVASLAWRGAGLVGVGPSDPGIAAAIGVTLESLWAAGVFLFAAPIDDPEAVTRGLGARSSLRRAARFLQLGWPIAMAAERSRAIVPGSPLDPVLEWTALAAWGVGGAGLIVLALLLIRWAEWMQDEQSEKWSRLFLWSAGGLPAAAVLAGLLQAVMPPLVLLPVLLGLACGLGLLFLLPMSLMSIANGLDWTVSWQALRAEQDSDLRRQVRSRGEAPPPPPPEDDAPIPLA